MYGRGVSVYTKSPKPINLNTCLICVIMTHDTLEKGFQTLSWGPTVYAGFNSNHKSNLNCNKLFIVLNYTVLMSI